MNQWKRLIFFLLLNLLVSACTTITVLYLWDQFRAPLLGGLISSLPPDSSVSSTATPATLPTEALQSLPIPTPTFLIHAVLDGDTFESIAQSYRVSVEDLVAANGYTQSQILSPGELLRVPVLPVVISSVIGAGDLETEHVVLQNNQDGELSLAGWAIEDSEGNRYTFPQVKIFIKDGALSLYSKAGGDSIAELYWGLNFAIWQPGETVTLRDPQGNIQATYQVP